MTRLSYSSLSNLYNGHEWINKMLGISVPNYPFLKEGKDGHRIIQDHIADIKKHEYLKDIKVKFHIVEEKDFDERCRFSFEVDGYEIIGFHDGRDENYRRTVEIKLSSTPWSISKFKKDVQRKLYALSNPKIEEQFLITGHRDIEKWNDDPPKIYSLRPSKSDREEGLEWIKGGIAILEKGDFTGGLDESGRCTGCFWNMARYSELANCNFL